MNYTPEQLQHIANVARPQRANETPRAYLAAMWASLRMAPASLGYLWQMPGAEGLNPWRFGSAIFGNLPTAAATDPAGYLAMLEEMADQPFGIVPPWTQARMPSPKLAGMVGTGNVTHLVAASQWVSGMAPYGPQGGVPYPSNLGGAAMRVAGRMAEIKAERDAAANAAAAAAGEEPPFPPPPPPAQAAKAAMAASKGPALAAINASYNKTMAATRKMQEENPALAVDDALTAAQRAAQDAMNELGNILDGLAGIAKTAVIGAAIVAAIAAAYYVFR